MMQFELCSQVEAEDIKCLLLPKGMNAWYNNVILYKKTQLSHRCPQPLQQKLYSLELAGQRKHRPPGQCSKPQDSLPKVQPKYLPLSTLLEKEMAIHSSTIAWKIPWTEGPGGLQSMGSQRVGHD